MNHSEKERLLKKLSEKCKQAKVFFKIVSNIILDTGWSMLRSMGLDVVAASYKTSTFRVTDISTIIIDDDASPSSL